MIIYTPARPIPTGITECYTWFRRWVSSACSSLSCSGEQNADRADTGWIRSQRSDDKDEAFALLLFNSRAKNGFVACDNWCVQSAKIGTPGETVGVPASEMFRT